MKGSMRLLCFGFALGLAGLGLDSCATTGSGRTVAPSGPSAAVGRLQTTASKAGADESGALESHAVKGVHPGPRGSVGGVSALRLSHLSRGINLGSLFAAGANPLRYESGITETDLVLLRKEGFTFCRLPIDPSLLFDAQNPSKLKPAVRYVDRVVDLALAAGLSIIIDPIHTSSSEHAFEGALATNPAFAAKVAEYWRAIASRYSRRDPSRVFFEIMNEPHASAFTGVSAAWWPPVEERLAQAIRAAAPRNTIVATGEKWGSIAGLLATRPLPISDVVYSIHYYDPFPFTHQGATWTAPVERALRDIPFPSSPEAVARILPEIRGTAARRLVLRYGRQRWNIDTIRGEISKAVQWAGRYHVPLIDGEFGVFKPFAPAAARYRWLRDVRTVLEGYHIGWAMWQYDSSFGLVDYEYPGISSGTKIDEECLAALGLSEAGPNRIASRIGAFDRSPDATLTMPVSWLGGLWTRVPHAGTDALASAPSAGSEAPATRTAAPPAGAAAPADSARLVIKGNTAWVVRPNLTLPVATGQRYRLSAEALVSGGGSCELAVFAYYPDGSPMSSPAALLPVARTGRWDRLSTEFFPPLGAARIALRWSGKGPAVIELQAIRLVKIS